jgi:hypothetical protein
MKKVVMCIICLAGLVVAGCATRKETGQYVGKGVETVNQVSKTIIGAARAQKDANQKILDTYETSVDESSTENRMFFAELEQKHEKQEQLVNDIILGLTTVAIESLPAGSTALRIAETVVGQIDGATSKTLQEANKKIEEVAKIAEENKKIISEVKATADKMEGEIATLKEGKNTIEKDFAVASKRFDSLSDTMKEQLGEVPPSVLLELEKLKGNNAAFRDMFQQKMQFTDEEMKSLEGMSTNELLTMLMLATGAAGAGGVFGKTGKSRSAAEVAKLTDNVNKLEGRVMGRPWENKPNDNPSTL